jgi:hypothetical protein
LPFHVPFEFLYFTFFFTNGPDGHTAICHVQTDGAPINFFDSDWQIPQAWKKGATGWYFQ